MQDRKSDTRDKIQLGGLIVKAGIRSLDKAVILGALIDLSEAIKANDEARILYYKKKGEDAFKG